MNGSVRLDFGFWNCIPKVLTSTPQRTYGLRSSPHVLFKCIYSELWPRDQLHRQKQTTVMQYLSNCNMQPCMLVEQHIGTLWVDVLSECIRRQSQHAAIRNCTAAISDQSSHVRWGLFCWGCFLFVPSKITWQQTSFGKTHWLKTGVLLPTLVSLWRVQSNTAERRKLKSDDNTFRKRYWWCVPAHTQHDFKWHRLIGQRCCWVSTKVYKPRWQLAWLQLYPFLPCVLMVIRQ